MNPTRRIVVLALATQTFLIAASWLATSWSGRPPAWGRPLSGLLIGLAVATLLAALNYLLLTRAPANWLVDGVRAVYDDVLVPLFAKLSMPSVIAIGAAAGIGEEWFFRGVLQPAVGLTAASLLFGLAHIGGWRMVAFGVWASGMGVILGGLAVVTGGLMAPMVAHGVYDIFALAYVRRETRNT